MQHGIKVLQIGESAKEFGGIEAFLYENYKYFNRELVHWDYLYFHSNPFERKIDSPILEKSKFYVLNFNDNDWRKLGIIRYAILYKQLLEFLNSNHYEVVHLHVGSTIIQFICMLVIRNINHTRLVLHAHSKTPRNILKEILICNPLRRLSIKHCDYLMSCSIPAGKYLFGSISNFFVIPNGVDVSRFCFNPSFRATMRDQLELSGLFVLGHVARLTKVKNQSFLLKVFYEFNRLCPKSKLLIVGDGEMRTVLENEAKDLGISDSVIFAGAKTNTEAYYQAMDVFVLPSFSEGLSIVTVEAQASGIPCVVSTGVPKEADIGAGLVLRKDLSDGEESWAETILSFRNFKRKDTSDAVRRAGFDVATTAAWLEDFYLRVASGEKVVLKK